MAKSQRDFWHCPICHAENHVCDADCQFSDEHEHATSKPWVDGGPNTCDRCGAALCALGASDAD